MINPLLCTDAIRNWKDGEEDSSSVVIQLIYKEVPQLFQ
jgi:hypothetical protein